MPGMRGIEDDCPVEPAIDGLYELFRPGVVGIVCPQAERAAPGGIPAARQVHDEIQAPLELELRMQRIVQVHIQLAAAAMEVPAAAMQAGVRAQALDAGQSIQVAKKPIIEIREYPVGRRWKAVPVIQRALFLDGIAVLHPGTVIERRNVAL